MDQAVQNLLRRVNLSRIEILGSGGSDSFLSVPCLSYRYVRFWLQFDKASGRNPAYLGVVRVVRRPVDGPIADCALVLALGFDLVRCLFVSGGVASQVSWVP